MIAHITTESEITMILDGQAYTMPRDSAQAEMLLAELRSQSPDKAKLVKLASMATAVELYSDGGIKIMNDGRVEKDGVALPPVLAEKVYQCFKDGVPYKHLANFFSRLEANTSRRAIEGLYQFLGHLGMPITEDGHFLGYKGVGADYMDIHSHKFLNTPGAVLTMERKEVCDDADIGCSYGYHVGSHEYATHWAGESGHVMIVEVDPADVVSIPKDCEFQKLRTCKYKVVCESLGKMGDGGVGDSEKPYQTAFAFKVDEDEGDDVEFGFDEGDEDDFEDKTPEDPVLAVAYKAGETRANALLEKGIVVLESDKYFSASALRNLKAAYGGSDAALESYLDGFKAVMGD